MESLTPFENLTLEAVCFALDNAVIDWMAHDEKTIYVTGHDFPTFWKIDKKRQFLIYYTFLDADVGTDDSEFQAFANACNRRLMLVQFSFQSADDGVRRLYGHHALSLKDGVNFRQVIRTGKIFADIFDDAANEGVAKGLLIPIGSGDDADEPDAENATKH